MDIQNYSDLLEHSYSTYIDHSQQNETRLEYLATAVFGFITYERKQAEIITRKALEVAAAITNRTTFEYIENTDNRTWYLVMCNMPFFADKLEWGGSIRGAWWHPNTKKVFTLESYGFYDKDSDDEQICIQYFSDSDEWSRFIKAILAFATR